MSTDWEPHKDTLRTLYIERDETLKTIMAHMRKSYEFTKNKGQYERQFRKWGFSKNSTAMSWKIIDRKIKEREKRGKTSMVRRGGEEVPKRIIIKERQRYGPTITEELFETGDLPPTPEGFTVSTPQVLVACTPKALTVYTPPRCESAPLILIDNLHSLVPFHQSRPHVNGSADVQSDVSKHGFPLRSLSLLGNDGEGSDTELATVLTQGPDLLSSLANLDVASESESFDADSHSALSRTSRTSKAFRRLLSLFYFVNNNQLSEPQAAELFQVISQGINRKFFEALIAIVSPTTKSIARMFLPAAVEYVDAHMVKLLLATGVNPNFHVQETMISLLVTAIRSGSTEIVQHFLSHGAFVNVSRYDVDDTPLEAATRTGRLDIVRLLLQNGASVNVPGPGHGASALALAASDGNLELLQLLIDSGADLLVSRRGFTDTAYHGITAMRIVAMRGDIAMAKVMLSYGANSNVLQSAAIGGHPEMVRLLLSSGANDIVEALQFAGSHNQHHILNFLVRLGVETHGTLQDTFGRAAFEAAIRCGQHPLLEWLLDSDIGVSVTPAILTTALETAVQYGEFSVAQLLVTRGAGGQRARHCSSVVNST